MSLEEMISNVEKSISELKAFLVQESLLVANPDDESALIANQDPEAIEAFNARKFLDIRF
jgi:hypothetical protein